MAEPKEIGTVWTLGCDVFIEDALTADVQEIKVNDIVLSANIFTEGLSVDVGSDRVNAMDLDVRISMDGLKTYIIDSQIVPYEDVLKITDFSPEATNEKRYASSANTSKKIIDSVGELKGRVNVAEGDIDALGKRVDDLELKGTGGSGDGFWYLNEQDGKIHTDIGIVVHGDAIVEGDTSSGGSGEDVVVGIQGVRVNGTTHYDEDGDGVVDLGTIESGGGGLTSVSWGDIQGTPPSVSTFNNDVPYVTDEELKPLGEEIELLSSMWHLDENGNLVTDKQVLIKNNLIVEQDTSSGGEGEDTPSGGISGVRVNGVTYYDDNGDGVIDLGTISGGGGTADLSNYYTKAQSDARYLALNGGGQVVGSTDTPLYLKSGASDSYIGFKNSSDSFLGYYGFRGTTPIVYSGVSSAYYLIHSGNIESYAITPVGGTMNGALTSYGGFISYGTPSFTAIRESGWSYLRLQSASHVWDIATTNASDGMLNTPYALEFRDGGQGHWGFALRYNTSSYGIGVFVANGDEASIGFLSNSYASSNKLPQWVIGNRNAETFGFWNTSSARFGITISKDFSTNVEGNICINRPTNYSNDYDEGLRCNLGGSQSWAGVVIGGAAFSTSGAGVGVYSLLVNNQLFRIRQNYTDVLTINTSNNVGIGTDSPSYKLDVVGDARVSGRLYSNLGEFVNQFFTVPSAGWYSIARFTDGYRQSFECAISFTGGNYTPAVVKVSGHTSWAVSTCYAKIEGSVQRIHGVRFVTDGTYYYLQLYFDGSVVSNAKILVPYCNFGMAQQNTGVLWYSGQLPTLTPSEYGPRFTVASASDIVLSDLAISGNLIVGGDVASA